MTYRPSAYWDAIVGRYPERLSLLYQKKKHFDHCLIKNKDHGRVLDSGCGKGTDAIHFAAMNFSQVYAIDFSSRMCESAKSNIGIYLPSDLRHKVNIQQMDAQKLSFPDGFFDVTCSFSTIDHIPTKEGRDLAIYELIRVTKPGGDIIITFPNTLSIASKLKDIEEIVVTPAYINSRDVIKIMDRNSGCWSDEYEHEVTVLIPRY